MATGEGFNLEALRSLGDVDRRLNRARRRLERATDLAAPQRTRVSGIKAELKELAVSIRESQKAIKTHELEMGSREADREKAEVALNQAKSNNDYQTFLGVIERKKVQVSESETLVLEAYEVHEANEAKTVAGKARLKSQEKELAEANLRVKAEEELVSAEVAKEEACRAEAAGQLSQKHLALYERLREQQSDPLAEIRDGMCQGCGLTVRPEQISLARGAKLLVTCGNCQRILWMVPPA
ncbi:MAG: hypothetical protein JKY65_10395 [Planctomycetes bacterium]|nr:hypothetical protein [Planctomycetota bacterium]